MDLRLVPTSKARVKRLISRDPSPLQLQQRRKDESSFELQEMLSQRPPTDVRAILNQAVDGLRKEGEAGGEKTSRDQHSSTLFIEIQAPLLSKLQVSTQFLLVKIDNVDFWMERFGGDIWGVFKRQEVRERVTQSRDPDMSRDQTHDPGTTSRDVDTQEEDTQEDTQEDPPRLDVSPHKLLGRGHVINTSTNHSHVSTTSRDDILSRAPVAQSSSTNRSETFTSLIASLPPPRSTLTTPYIPLNLTKPVSALPLPSVSVSELLLSSYRSQLYCCKTSLIYFAKAMSKSRALCKSTLEKHTQGKSRVFSASQMRKMSYKLYSRELAKLVQPLSEWSQVYEYAEFCKMMTNTKDEHVIQWKESLAYSVKSDADKLAAEISLLKFREMQLQSIVLLELLAVAPVTKSRDDADSAKQMELDKQKKKEARKMGLYKSRRGKVEDKTPITEDSSKDYKTLLTQLFSSMCIWQQLSDSASGTDHVHEFCKSVVIPYFSSRVPQVVEDLLKRAGLEREVKQQSRVNHVMMQTRSRDVKPGSATAADSRDSPNLSRDSTPRAMSPSSFSRDSDTLHSDVSTSSGVSRAAAVQATRTASRTNSGVTGLLTKPQVRGGLLTSSRSFDSRSQIGMRFKGGNNKEKDKDKEDVKMSNQVAGVTTGETGMFRKTRDVHVTNSTRHSANSVQSQVDATPVKRTRPVLTSFTAEPDNPFVNDSHVIDDSPFAKRMRGEGSSSGPRRRLGLGDGTSVIFDSARRQRQSHVMGQGHVDDFGHVDDSDHVTESVDDSPVHRSSRYSVVMESPTRTRTLGVGGNRGDSLGSGGNHGNGGNRGNQGNGGLFSNRPKTLFSSQTTIRPSMAAPVAPAAPVTCVSATPKRRTQPTLITNEEYPREDNPFYHGTDDAVMDTSPTKRRD